MTENSTLGLPEAAQKLGVSLRVLRRAMRAGTIAAPANLTATSTLSAEWLASARDAAARDPSVLSRSFLQRVPPYARYKGTSVWHQYHAKVRAHRWYRANKA
jgi:hypothetical protein